MGAQSSSARRMAVIASIYMFFTTGAIMVYVIPYGQLPEYFGVSFAQLGLGAALSGVIGFLGSSIAAKVIGRLGTRKLMLLAAVCLVCHALVIMSVHNLVGLLASFFFLGFIVAFAQYACVTDFLTKWFEKDLATNIGIAVGAGLVGTGVIQFAAGQLLETLGVTNLFLVFDLTIAAIDVVCALLVRDTPAQLGEQPYGHDEVTVAAMASDEPAAAVATVDASSLYRRPSFWLLMLGTLFGGYVPICWVSVYMTSYFPTLGIDVALAATLVSAMGLASGGFNMIGGRIMERIGVHSYVPLLFVAMVVANLGMWYVSVNQSAWVIALVVVGYAIGYTGATVCNMMAAPLFGADLATEANTKLMMVVFGGSAVANVVMGKLVDSFGFATLFLICVGLSVVAGLLHVAAFAAARREEHAEERVSSPQVA